MTTVLLENDTVGIVIGQTDVEEGDIVTVALHDENGMPIKATGKVVEILEP